MLIPSMTFYEMYEELIADRAKLEYKRQQLTPKAIKAFGKQIVFQPGNGLNTQFLAGIIRTSYFFMPPTGKLLKILYLIIFL